MATGGTLSGGTAPDEFRERLRFYEYDRYIAALLMPRAAREALMLISAFAAELRHIPVTVSEPMLGAIRLQWWRDVVSGWSGPKWDEGAATGHPLADALADVVTKYGLPVGLLQGMIDATETELNPTPLGDETDVGQVFGKWDGAAFALSARVLGGGMSVDQRRAAGVHYGAARAAAEFAARYAAGVQTYVVAGSRDASTLVAMSRAAGSELDKMRSDLDAPAKRALLPIATVPRYVASAAMPPQHSRAIEPPSRLGRASAILWRHWRGRL